MSIHDHDILAAVSKAIELRQELHEAGRWRPVELVEVGRRMKGAELRRLCKVTQDMISRLVRLAEQPDDLAPRAYRGAIRWSCGHALSGRDLDRNAPDVCPVCQDPNAPAVREVLEP